MPPPSIYKMKPADLVAHPTGGTIFGVIPAITALNLNLPKALIYLKAGEHHTGVGKQPSGHGVKHLWEGKKRWLRQKGCKSPEDVATFIANLIIQGTEIYHDHAHAKAGKKRITLLRTVDGTLTLEPRPGDRALGFHYAVVTWTPQPNPRGTQVGVVEIDWAKEKATLGSPLNSAEAVVAAIL